jgi:hypothetical protein
MLTGWVEVHVRKCRNPKASLKKNKTNAKSSLDGTTKDIMSVLTMRKKKTRFIILRKKAYRRP